MTPEEIEAEVEFHGWFDGCPDFAQLGRRLPTFYEALALARARGARRIVETGTTRKAGNWLGDGQSTCVLGAFAARYGARLWTCDLSADAIGVARGLTREWAGSVEYVVGDSVAFLRAFDGPIGLLYLDSHDFDARRPGPAQAHALAEARAALPALRDRSVILIDDCELPHGGKGGAAIPFLLGEGWRVALRGYQVLLTRDG